MFSYWVDFISPIDNDICLKLQTCLSSWKTNGGFLTYADNAESAVLRCLECNVHKDIEITAVYREK